MSAVTDGFIPTLISVQNGLENVGIGGKGEQFEALTRGAPVLLYGISLCRGSCDSSDVRKRS